MNNPFSKLRSKEWLSFFLTALFVIALDQVTKILILRNIEQGHSIEIIPGLFNLVLAYNLGAAFGMLADLQDGVRQLVLAGTTFLALMVVFYFLLFEYAGSRVGRIALAMIFGGALGNIIDRIRLGMVVDFLDLYVGERHWPAFNVADSSICIAVFLLLFQRPRRSN